MTKLKYAKFYFPFLLLFGFQSEEAKIIFDGNLIWNLNCSLDENANKSVMDSIAKKLNTRVFDSCFVMCYSYHKKVESFHCGTKKANEVKLMLLKYGINRHKIIIKAENYLAEKPSKTRTVISIY